MRRTLSIVGAVILASALLANPAFAQSSGSSSGPSIGSMEGAGGLNDKSVHTRSTGITLWGFLPVAYGLGIGVGGRFTLPILADGFLPDLNDSFEIELGADVAFGTYFSYSYLDLSLVPLEGRWTFHFTPALDAYAKLGVGYTLTFTTYSGTPWHTPFYMNFAIGGMYHLSEKLSLRLEAGYQGLRGGIAFDF